MKRPLSRAHSGAILHLIGFVTRALGPLISGPRLNLDKMDKFFGDDLMIYKEIFILGLRVSIDSVE